MEGKMKKNLGFALVLVFLTLLLPSASRALCIGTGQQMPEFWAYDLEGNKVSINDYRGKVVMLAFWASWCPRCMDELTYLQKNFAGTNGDLVVLAVNQETRMLSPQHVEKLKADVKQMGLTFPVILDKDFDAYKKLCIAALPTSIVIDREGKVVYAATTYYTDTANSIKETLKSLGISTEKGK
jgi:peroxiredoxin